MLQKVDTKILYIYSRTPYLIIDDTDAEKIFVQPEAVNGFKELNPDLTDKIEGRNFYVICNHEPDEYQYRDVKEEVEIGLNSELSADGMTVNTTTNNIKVLDTQADFRPFGYAKPFMDIEYSSSYENVATIDSNGMVSVKGIGTTTLTQSMPSNVFYENFEEYAYLEVYSKISPNISWSANSYTAQIGETANYPTISNPNNVELTYSSSNTNIATIDVLTGEITLVDAGDTTITCNAIEDSSYSAQSVNYDLTVLAAKINPNLSWSANSYAVTMNEFTEGTLNDEEFSHNFVFAEWDDGISDYSFTYNANIIEYDIKVNKNYQGNYNSSNGIQIETRGGEYSLDGYGPYIEYDYATDTISLYDDNEYFITSYSIDYDTLQDNSYYLVHVKVKLLPYLGKMIQIYGSIDEKLEVLPNFRFAYEDPQNPFEQITFPTLSNPNLVDVSYSSSNKQVAQISTNGSIKLIDSGNSYIYANFDGDSSYSPQSTYYYLTVENPSVITPLATLNVTTKTETLSYSYPNESKTKTLFEIPDYMTQGFVYDSNDWTFTVNDTSICEITSTTGSISGNGQNYKLTNTLTCKNTGSTYITATFAGDSTFDSGEYISYITLNYSGQPAAQTPDYSWANSTVTIDYDGGAGDPSGTNPNSLIGAQANGALGLTLHYSSDGVIDVDSDTGEIIGVHYENFVGGSGTGTITVYNSATVGWAAHSDSYEITIYNYDDGTGGGGEPEEPTPTIGMSGESWNMKPGDSISNTLILSFTDPNDGSSFSVNDFGVLELNSSYQNDVFNDITLTSISLDGSTWEVRGTVSASSTGTANDADDAIIEYYGNGTWGAENVMVSMMLRD